jgi:hypothetical protein
VKQEPNPKPSNIENMHITRPPYIKETASTTSPQVILKSQTLSTQLHAMSFHELSYDFFMNNTKKIPTTLIEFTHST